MKKLLICLTLITTITSAQACETNTIEEVLGDGSIIKLQDGTIYQVNTSDESTASTWTSLTEVVVCDDKIINTEDNESVEVTQLK